MIATPTSSVISRNVRSFRRRSIRPVTPIPATTAVATMSQVAVACAYPAGHQGKPSTGTNATQSCAPRRMFVSDVTPVVAVALSVYGMNGNPYPAMSSSGTAHQNVANAVNTTHQVISRRRRGPRRRVSRYSAGMASTAASAAALMPPQANVASADQAAARRGLYPSRAPLISGSTIHGSMAVGQNSEELTPTRVCACGASANAKPAMSRVTGEPMRSASASLTAPRNATHSTSDSHNRCTIQDGIPMASNSA